MCGHSTRRRDEASIGFVTDHEHDCHEVEKRALLARLEVVLVIRLEYDWPMITSILEAVSDDEMPKAA